MSLVKDNTQNLFYINAIKTWGIICVLFVHLTVPYTIVCFISTFRMPLFFFVTGYLFSRKNYTIKQFIEHKGRALLIPYLFFATVTFLFWLASQFFIEGNIDSEKLSHYLIGIFYAPASKEFLGFNIPIWFLPALFVSEVIFFLITRYVKKHTFIFTCLLFGLGIVLKEILTFRLPWGSDVALFAVLFIQLGYFVRKKDFVDKYLVSKTQSFKLAVAFIFLLLTIAFTSINGLESSISFYMLHFNNYGLLILNALCGIIFMFALGTSMPQHKLLNFYGRNTIILLGFHLMVFAILKSFQVYALKIPLDTLSSNIPYNLVYLLLTMLVMIPVIMVINKYFPFVIGRKKAILQ